MYQLKTQQNDTSVLEFIELVENQRRKEDALMLLDIITELTGESATMWGNSIIGFGKYTYQYASGQQGDWMRFGFSPRKANMSLYIMNGFSSYQDHLDKLGKHKTGKSCLYINKLADVDLEVLKMMIKSSFESQLGTEKK